MRSFGWVLPKRKLGHGHTCQEQKEDGHLQVKVRGLWRNQPCPHRELGLVTFRTGGGENKCPLLEPPSVWYFVMAALENWYPNIQIYRVARTGRRGRKGSECSGSTLAILAHQLVTEHPPGAKSCHSRQEFSSEQMHTFPALQTLTAYQSTLQGGSLKMPTSTPCIRVPGCHLLP